MMGFSSRGGNVISGMEGTFLRMFPTTIRMNH